MADAPSPDTKVKNQVDGVLQDYLDQLLVVATETRVSTIMPEPEPEADKGTLIVDGELQGWDIPEEPAAPMPVVVQEASLVVPSTDLLAEHAVRQMVESESDAGLRTETRALNWASSQGVECLIFKVAGLKLAIPLPLLGGVYPVEGKVTPLFGQASWSLGVWQADGEKMTVIDSAQLIMPERGVSLADEGYEYLIQLDNAPWALACQEICDTVTLVSESIKWRGDLSKRPWLAGTVISEMCALLDVPGLIELADSQRKAS